LLEVRACDLEPAAVIANRTLGEVRPHSHRGVAGTFAERDQLIRQLVGDAHVAADQGGDLATKENEKRLAGVAESFGELASPRVRLLGLGRAPPLRVPEQLHDRELHDELLLRARRRVGERGQHGEGALIVTDRLALRAARARALSRVLPCGGRGVGFVRLAVMVRQQPGLHLAIRETARGVHGRSWSAARAAVS
jgi:hypothetical protein